MRSLWRLEGKQRDLGKQKGRWSGNKRNRVKQRTSERTDGPTEGSAMHWKVNTGSMRGKGGKWGGPK